MLRSLTRWSLVALLPLALAAACGSDDGKKHSSREDGGGEAGQAGAKPSSGGSMSVAGQPAQGGAGGTPEPVATGGAGGEAPVIPSGGVGGEEPMALGGSGGEGGDQGMCCQPLVCDTATLGCRAYIADGCGHTSNCTCAPGEVCNDSSTCQTCEPDPDFCANNSSACGDTTDNCGNPITCPDVCGEGDAVCVEGNCCTPSTDCSGVCGTVSDGCGGTLECGDTCDGGTCNAVHQCCTVNNGACVETECGYEFDGCKDVLCGQCGDTQGCVDHSCYESACKPLGYECGAVANPNAEGAFEDCGTCAQNETCIDNLCVPICR